MTLNVHVSKVEEDPVAPVHCDDPGAVGIVGVVVRKLRRMDLSSRSCDSSTTALKYQVHDKLSRASTKN